VKIFTILGIVFLVVGGYFAYLALQPASDAIDVGHEAAPILAITFLPIGIIFTLVGLYVTRLGSARNKLLQTGVPGQATVMGAAETGVYINERPMVRLQLNVSVPGRAPYSVEHSEVIPLIALGMITPGSSLPVVVDGTDPQKLMVDWSGETRARAMSAAAAMGTYPTVAQAGVGMPLPNTLSSGVSAPAPNTLSGAPQVGAAGGSGADPTSGVGFAMPMGMLGMTGMTGGTQGQPMFSFGGTGIDLSGIYKQLAAAGVTITGGMPQMMGSSTTVIDARPGDVAEHLAQLKGSGGSGTAAVTGVQDMGMAIHGNQLTMLELNVTPQGGAAYPARVTALVPPAEAGRAVVGGSLPVFIDHSNPQNLAIDWDAA
jgi:hypothetical protein